MHRDPGQTEVAEHSPLDLSKEGGQLDSTSCHLGRMWDLHGQIFNRPGRLKYEIPTPKVKSLHTLSAIQAK